MALKCAIHLGIPDAIQKHGKPITLCELANSLSLHPNKAPSLCRLMRLLVHSKIFNKQISVNGEVAFDININSQLLLKNHPLTLAPFALMALDPISIEPSYYFDSWFQNEEETPFHMTQRRSFWECASRSPRLNKLFNEAMTSDSQFVVSVLVTNNEFKGLLEGVKSMVDVGGGAGTMAKGIAKLFPELTCTVFDQPHVVKGLVGYEGNFKYVGGDMFEAIPHAQAVLLKSILHDWSDDFCVKILKQCKEAIPSKEQGGKVIIIDMVVETNTREESLHYSHSQLMFDMEMMNLTVGGMERTEEEWQKLFITAGFYDYKVYSMLGPRSVIVVYPS